MGDMLKMFTPADGIMLIEAKDALDSLRDCGRGGLLLFGCATDVVVSFRFRAWGSGGMVVKVRCTRISVRIDLKIDFIVR